MTRTSHRTLTITVAALAVAALAVAGVACSDASGSVRQARDTATTTTINALTTVSGTTVFDGRRGHHDDADDHATSATTARREVITFDGSAVAKMVLTTDGTTQSCTIPLPHGRPTCQ